MANRNEKVFIVLPAYFAAKTLPNVYRKIPKEYIDEIILVDDASNDGIEPIAKSLGIRFFCNSQNLGYGGNLKVCFQKALDLGADIVIELHPDDQYDPGAIPDAIDQVRKGYGLVSGSRFMKFGIALKNGMPLWKYVINQLSRPLCWLALGVNLSDYHCGLRAYHRRFLEAVNFVGNDDDYLFAFQILFQAVLAKVGVS
ncbi:MAG: glycosyltransferase family 2 protein, partial [Candidatus Omnitrophica bacterium]|nr:glycosyltransferase family 2 protein [Candidatus Omnitrophota bacterium]